MLLGVDPATEHIPLPRTHSPRGREGVLGCQAQQTAGIATQHGTFRLWL